MTKDIKTVLIFGFIFAVLAGVAFYVANGTRAEVEAKEAEIAALKAEIATLSKEAAKEEGLLERLDSLKANFSQYVKILPSPEVATEERLMVMLQEKCERSQFGLGSYSVKKARRRAKSKRGRRKKAGGGFKEIDVTLQAKGTFEQFLRFLNSLERHESFLRVNSFTCSAAVKAEINAEGKDIWPLGITLNISTFRYDSGS